jgi:ubiquinone/menaquinone biosynthesis C-methylase UbiE
MAAELKNLLIRRIHDRQLIRFAKTYFNGKLIDIGCGEKPYAASLRQFVSEHVGVDHADSPHQNSQADRICTAYSLPFQDNTFDCALCTAVLEHLEEPAQAVQECYRVLKPHAHAIYSAPFIWHLHEEPRDFFRYSKYGFRHLFEKAGFRVVEIVPLSGFWVTFGQLLVYNLYRANVGPLRWLRLIDLAGLLMQGFFFLLDKVDRTYQWTWAYMIVAEKHVIAKSAGSE